MARSGSDGEPQQHVAGHDALEPQVLSLDEVLRAYEQPINEEQAWAVCYQCCRSLHRDWPQEQVRTGRVRELAAILLHRDGTVSLCGEDHNRPPLPGSKANISPRLCTEGEIVQSLGFAIYRALDWGLDENEERELSQQLEQLIDQMANNDSEGSNGTADEGYSGQDDEEEGDVPQRSVKTFEQVMKACAAHLLNRNEADSHFQAVCRALFVETLELQTFLVKIKDAKEMLKKMQFGESETQIPLVELDNLNHTDWARLWVQLMRDLRHGVKLKKVQEKQYNPLPTEYHLTPFEMLMQDIKARKYKLRKVMVDGDIPPCVKKNAHELILEFIRSRPPLKPVSERNLGPKPPKPRSLHERILEEIKSKKKLRPVHAASRNKNKEVTFGSLPCLVHACSDDLKSTSCIDLSVPESMGSTQRPRPRVLLKAPTLAEMDEMNISEEEESPSAEMRRVTSSPIPLKRDRSFSEHDLQRLQTELALSQSESAHLSKVSENETVIGTTPLHQVRENAEMQPINFQAAESTRSCLVMEDNFRSVKGIPETLPTFSKRQWLEEFSHPVESLALTVEEVINVRKVLVKAEMEKFLPNKDLYNSLKKGKVCCCCKMKFPLFSWPSTCLLCKRSVCGSCNLKIKIPSKKFAHIPVYTVGFENLHGTAHTKGYFQSRSLKSLSNRSVEKEFPHLYTNGCSFKDICAECAKFVADVINSSCKSVNLLNNTPRRKVQSMYVRSTRS